MVGAAQGQVVPGPAVRRRHRSEVAGNGPAVARVAGPGRARAHGRGAAAAAERSRVADGAVQAGSEVRRGFTTKAQRTRRRTEENELNSPSNFLCVLCAFVV